jgi:hypothetical protein
MLSAGTKLLREIRERKEEIAQAMMYGNVKNMEHYRELVGNIKTLQFVEERLVELSQQSEE